MKKTLRILSVLCALVLIIGTVSVGMSAYAASDNVIGDYEFSITNVYKDINWDNVKTYKGETHVHTVRSDADTEVDDMIHYYYDFGYDAMALTDHGTINYGWNHDQGRVAIFDYQVFVHGGIDLISDSDYKNMITGTRARTINNGKGMMEIPLGIELNGMSTVKCHVNGFYADADHGGLGMTEDWPLNAVKKYYNGGGFTHINHVGEWSGGNDDYTVYKPSFINDFVEIFEDYCPNRGGRNVAAQTSWMNSHKGQAGCIGMELVNTADSRTHNDRRYVYDEILKKLAPQGINVFGFCEDDAHEYSDCDRNAQFFLINGDKNVALSSSQFDMSNTESGKTSSYKNNNSDPMDKVQNYYRDAMFYGEFYASSKNSKNSYELGNGFNAKGAYPSISNITVDDTKDQIIVSFKDATKVRLVADGEIIETVKTNNGSNTVVFDLNAHEDKINSYVRIYLTGAGGITYLQPFLVSKAPSTTGNLQFVCPSSDVTVVVKNSTGAVVDDSYSYANYYYTLPAGEYTWTASRRGYQTKADQPFTVTQEEIDSGEHRKIPVELEEETSVTYAYFYAPETIYVSQSDGRTFEKYIDRENAIGGALHADPQSTGNIFFYREGATNLSLTGHIMTDATDVNANIGLDSLTVANATGTSNSISASVTGGVLNRTLSNTEHATIEWIVEYDYQGLHYKAYTYSYVYKTPNGASSVLAAGGYGKTCKAAGWLHTSMIVAATLYVTGVNVLEPASDANTAYKYSTFSPYPFEKEKNVSMTGSGLKYQSEAPNADSVYLNIINSSDAYIYADRSRIDNWSQLPYFSIGLDLNEADEVTGEDGRGIGDAYLLYNTGYTPAKDIPSGALSYDSSKLLYNMHFTSRSAYTETIDYNLTDSTKSVTNKTTGGNALASIGYKRLYQANNADSQTKFIKELPSASASSTNIPIYGFVHGTKANREENLSLQVTLTLVNIDKSSLRSEYNDTVKNCLQEEWFSTPEAFDAYMSVVRRAGIILGDPTADQEKIDAIKEELIEAFDSFSLKTGEVEVQHYWTYGGNEGLIYKETKYSFNYADDLSASAAGITGYTYANSFKRWDFDDRTFDPTAAPAETGTSDVNLVLGTKKNYVWRFYYTPSQYNITYDASSDIPFTDYTPTVRFEQPYTVATAVPQKTGYSFKGWYLDNDAKTYSSGQTIPSWDFADNGEFKAIWESNQYNVSYDVNTGNALYITDEYTKVNYGATYNVFPNAPTKTGYVFMGWQLNGGRSYTAGSTFTWEYTSDAEFVAQWELATYTVDFDKNAADAYYMIDGSMSTTADEISVHYGDPYGTLPTVMRNGYTAEWHSDKINPTNNTKCTADTNVSIDADHTLYAIWTPIDYEITYNLDGGAVPGNVNPSFYTIEDDDIVLTAPVKTGWTFVGWESSDFSGYKTEWTIPSGSTGPKTFTAHWTLKGYDIDYDLAGGVNDASNPKSYFSTDPTFSLKAPTRKGYRFTGWTGDNGSSPALVVTIAQGSTGDKSYTANWAIEDYTITYDYNNATTIPSNLNETYNVNTATFTLNNPERTGYTFEGWECNNEAFDGLTTVTIEKGSTVGNLTFKAIWAEKGANKVTYRLNGGVVENFNPSSYKDGESYTIYNPVKAGYTFDGWTEKIGNVDVPGKMLNASISSSDRGDIVFTATWKTITYTITYNLAGGRIASDASNLTSYNIETDDITVIAPIKTGYKFNGWTGTGLISAEKNLIIAKGSYGDREYTATWVPNNYKISYDYNGGTGSFIESYTSSTDALIGTPVRPGYSFNGWSISFTDFTWTEGSVDSATGKFIAADDVYYSDGVVLRAGKTYTVNSSVSNVKMYAFIKSDSGAEVFFREVTGGTYTPGVDSVVYIVAPVESVDALRSLELDVSSSAAITSYALIPETVSSFGSAGNMSMTANWTSQAYTITYNYNNVGLNDVSFGKDSSGNELPDPNPATYTYDSSDIRLQNPTMVGYDFLGWEYVDENGATVQSTTVVIRNHSTGNKSFKAMWQLSDYIITYTGIEGATFTSANPASYKITDAAITLINPEKTGYTFTGWMGTGLDSASTTVVIPSGSTGNRAYRATWTPESYSITYNGVEGAVNNNPGGYTIETETFTLSDPTKDGAVFDGWSSTEFADITKNVTIAKGTAGNKTYTANWTLTDYNITYNLAGGTQTTNPTTYNVNTETFTLGQPSRSGYTFSGWTGTGLSGLTPYPTITKGSIGNREYTANWNPINYSITYNLDGGMVAENANRTIYNIETGSFILVNPVKTGSVFAGWVGTGLTEPTMEVTVQRGSIGNRTYTATWNDDYYVITYINVDLPGVVLPAENRTSYTAATNDFTLNNPTRPGYTFDGWSGTEISGTGISKSVTIPKGSTGARIYTANWSLETYNITYELDGATGGLANPEKYTFTSAPIKLNAPTKTGYDFLGWSSDYYTGIVKDVVIETGSVTGDITFTANWQAGNYVITLDPDGGTLPSGQATTINYTSSSADIVIPNPEKDGHTFLGWALVTSSGVSASTETDLVIPSGSTGNRDYIAVWAAGSNAISYNLNGGDVLNGTNPTQFSTGDGLIVLVNPTKGGYKFTGWSGTGILEGELSDYVAIDTAEGGSYQFTANWAPSSYRISYNLNGGTVATANPRTYTIEDQFVLNNPTRAGYIFDGWTGTNQADPNTNVTVSTGNTGSRTYTANWKEESYTISYDYNGGSTGTPNPNTYTVVTPSFTLNNPEKTGYTFIGWTGTNGTTAQKIISIPTGSSGNRSYTANFSIETYNISYFGLENAIFEDGSGNEIDDPNPTSYDASSSDITLVNPKRAGYEFLGWLYDGVVNPVKNVTIPAGSSGDKEYTAQWRTEEYTITYVLEGGVVSGTNRETYTVETPNFTLVNPTKSGYVFTGWSGNGIPSDKPSKKVTIARGTTGNLTFNAVWNIAPFTITYTGLPSDYVHGLPATYYANEEVEIMDPSIDGYEFTGWTGTGLTAKTKNLVIPVGSTGNRSYKANWSLKEYPIDIDLDGGTATAETPETYTVETPTFSIAPPRKDGNRFIGWQLSNGEIVDSITITQGSTGERSYKAVWGPRTEGATHRIYFKGYADAPIYLFTTTQNGATVRCNFVDVEIGEYYNDSRLTDNISQIEETVGYKITGWDINWNDIKYRECDDDITVHAKWTVGDDKYTIIVNGTETSASTGQYEKFTATTEFSNAQGQLFSYWIAKEVDENGQATGASEIVSYYRQYAFYVHSNVVLTAVYGASSSLRASTRITKVEDYNADHDWFTVYTERSVATELVMNQHGLIFTSDPSIGGSEDAFKMKTSGVYKVVSSTKGLTGMWSLSIRNPLNFGENATVYLRSFVTVIDEDGNATTVYGSIKTYRNKDENNQNKDKWIDETTEGER